MNNQCGLTYWDCSHIKEILSDPKLSSAILMDGQIARYIRVQADGTIVLGKYKFNWVNKLFGEYTQISIVDFAINCSLVFFGNAQQNALFDSISKVVVDRRYREKDYKYIVDAIYDIYRNGWSEANNASTYMHIEPTKAKDISVRNLRLNSGEILGKIIIERT